jgi:hypothetical protein
MIAGLMAFLLIASDTSHHTTWTERPSQQVTPVDLTLVDTLTVEPPAVPTGVTDPAVRLVMPPPLQLPSLADQATDTTKKKRPALVAYSDWYGRRLAIHRTMSWAMIPLFAVSYYTGERLARDGFRNSPRNIRVIHPWAATSATVVFGVNTVTGVWNLWDARHDPEGRKRRIIHSVLFMIADAGFAYAGSIGQEARDDSAIRSRHRTIALSSMGVSYVSMMLMLLGGK